MMENIPMIAAGAGLFGLVVAFMLYQQVNKVKIDNEKVDDITSEIQDGAMAFLFAEYRVLAIFVVVVGIALTQLNDMNTAIAFFAGALASVLAGFSGMRAATSANGRTTMAAKNDGKAGALSVSYNGGAVMGLSVGGLGLLGISLVAYWLGAGDANPDLSAAAGEWVPHPSLCSHVLVAVFTPRLLTSVRTLLVRSRLVFLRMTLVTQVSLLTM